MAKYAKKTDGGIGIYDDEIHGADNIPDGAVEITDQEQEGLCNGSMVFDGTTVSLIQVDALATRKERAAYEITTICVNTKASATNNADHYKLAGWANKVPRATRVANGGTDPIDLAILQTEIDRRDKGESPVDLATLQLAKEVKLATLTADLDGAENLSVEAVEAATSVSVIDTLVDGFQTTCDVILGIYNG